MATDIEMLKALDKIESIVEKQGMDKLAVPTAKALCADYGKIKKYLEISLPLIDKIPVYGKKIAGAIRLLMTIADAICPAI